MSLWIIHLPGQGSWVCNAGDMMQSRRVMPRYPVIFRGIISTDPCSQLLCGPAARQFRCWSDIFSFGYNVRQDG